MRKSRSDYAFIAAICAAAHSRKVTCARPFNVLKFLGLRLSCFRALTDVLFSLFVPSALRGVQHVTICTFQFCKSFVSDLLSSSSWNVSLVLGPKNWYGLGSAGSGLPSIRQKKCGKSPAAAWGKVNICHALVRCLRKSTLGACSCRTLAISICHLGVLTPTCQSSKETRLETVWLLPLFRCDCAETQGICFFCSRNVWQLPLLEGDRAKTRGKCTLQSRLHKTEKTTQRFK